MKRSAKREDLKDRLIEGCRGAHSRLGAAGVAGARCHRRRRLRAGRALQCLCRSRRSCPARQFGDAGAARGCVGRGGGTRDRSESEIQGARQGLPIVRARQSRVVDGAVRASPAAGHDSARLVPPGTGGADPGPGRAARRAPAGTGQARLCWCARGRCFPRCTASWRFPSKDRFIGLAATDLEDEVLSFVDSMVTGIEKTAEARALSSAGRVTLWRQHAGRNSGSPTGAALPIFQRMSKATPLFRQSDRWRAPRPDVPDAGARPTSNGCAVSPSPRPMPRASTSSGPATSRRA